MAEDSLSPAARGSSSCCSTPAAKFCPSSGKQHGSTRPVTGTQCCTTPSTKFCPITGNLHNSPTTAPAQCRSCTNPSSEFCCETGEPHSKQDQECEDCSNPQAPFCAASGKAHSQKRSFSTLREVAEDEPACYLCLAGINEPCATGCEDKDLRDERIRDVGRPIPPKQPTPAASAAANPPSATSAAATAAGGAAGSSGVNVDVIPANADLQLSPSAIGQLPINRIIALPAGKILRVTNSHRVWIWGRKQREERTSAFTSLTGAMTQIVRPDDDRREDGKSVLHPSYLRQIRLFLWVYKTLLDPDPDLNAQAMQGRIQAVTERVAVELLSVPLARKKPLGLVGMALDHYFADGEADRLWTASVARAEKDFKDSPGSPTSSRFRSSKDQRGRGGGRGGGGSAGRGKDGKG